ncbi:transporter substrate-binding domain-containing protein [Terrilactibacillus sp. BCM23-1]|uniref:Transporter substrate-binding domain-containing protein n=1 Tax=Terrilactibacillus tamarindi TaxID=2599694 RepID=A0A6N8CVC1_9BACI|nr:ABC transporter substrate-binding protein [Terrilactibacillus tamarindi]MTT32206.1 transporter substrate-binding domain-containing protein [Terrilactibacillus tamarindi]
MKKIFMSVLVLTLLLIVLVGCGSKGSDSSSSSKSDSTLENAKKKGVLVIGSSNDAPFAFIDQKTKKFSGIDAEIIKEAARRLGIPKVEMKEIKFENLLLELNQKNIDMVTDGMYVTPEREKIAKFTNTWYKEGEALVVGKNSTIKGIADLKDKIVGAQKGSVFLNLANKLQKEGKIKRVVVFGSQSELFLAVKTNKIQASIVDGFVAAYSLQNDNSLNLKLVSPYKPQNTGIIAAAVRKNDTELYNAINKQIDELKENGFILKVFKKYGVTKDYFVPVSEEKH